MRRAVFYENLTPELLGYFYYTIRKKLSDGKTTSLLKNELKIIEKVAKKRGISLLELHILGHWVINKEKNELN